MVKYIIYHIPGRKVGCTRDMERRKQLYLTDEGSVPEMVILEELHDKTDQEAGDIEWQWADRLGYRRGQHYAKSAKFLADNARKAGQKGGVRRQESMTPEQRSEFGRKSVLSSNIGQRIANAQNAGIRSEVLTPEQRRERARIAALSYTPEQRSERSRKGGLISRFRGGFVQRGVCPHCGIETNLGMLSRWHFNKCRILAIES